MFSYEHRYHAGNFADVHKHIALMGVLQHLSQKPAPFTVMDTHAGEGWYDLQSSYAQRLKEYEQGVARFIQSKPTDPLAQAYCRVISAENPEGQWLRYPGSSAILVSFLREQDSGILIEHHPQAILALKQNMRKIRNIHIHDRDATSAIPALLPFAHKRGLIFVDPSYEVKSEYTAIANAVLSGYQRFSHGIFMIWYPLLPAGHHIALKQTLKKADLPSLIYHEWIPDRHQTQGLYGSGLAIINAPWQLEAQLKAIFPSK